MQMDLYKNNLAAEAASTLCAFKNLFKLLFQISIFHPPSYLIFLPGLLAPRLPLSWSEVCCVEAGAG